MTSRGKLIAAAFAMACVFGLSPSWAQQSIEEGAGDPSTPLGRSMIQNQQDQQQQQQNQQRDQQNWQAYQQGQQNRQNQYYGSGGGGGGGEMPSGPFGAIYFDPAHPMNGRSSYNYPSARAAEAAAMGACSQDAGHPCREAIEFHNACAVRAISRNGPWAARTASSAALARDMALDACQKAGGLSCVARTPDCSPNND